MIVPEELLVTAAAGEDPPPTRGGGGGGAATVGILSFEAASAMARLVSLHRSLSGPAARRFFSETTRSQGISYLNSGDQPFLLTLACAEILNSLDGAAAVISRLEKRRPSPASSKGFCRVYSDIKAGVFHPDNPSFRFSEKVAERRVRRMEKLVASTSSLWSEMQVAEAAKQKLAARLRRHVGGEVDDHELAMIGSLRRRVRRLKEVSLWSETFDGAVGVMAPAALYVFTRICSVFAPFVPGLPKVISLPGGSSAMALSPATSKILSSCQGLFSSSSSAGSSGCGDSCPIFRPPAPEPPEGGTSINSCPIFGSPAPERTRSSAGLLRAPRKIMAAAPDTVGGSGMAVLYAEVILRAEKMLAGAGDDDEAEERCREELYSLLPARIRCAVRAKLKDRWREGSPESRRDHRLSEGWREAAVAILQWLVPVARATLVWQEERGVDRRRRFDTSPRTLLIQTLHFSDAVKTDAAVVEVLVGISCSRWHGKPPLRSFTSMRSVC